MNGAELEEGLKELVETDGVNASAVVTRSGVMVEFRNKHSHEMTSSLSAVAAMMIRTAEKCAKILKKGNMEELVAKAEEGILLAEKYEEFILLVAVDKGVDFDLLKPKMDRIKKAIRSM